MNDYSPSQLAQINLGRRNGLTDEQLSILTPNYNTLQMKSIRNALEIGLSSYELDLLLDPELNTLQMDEIYKGFLDGLSFSQVRKYASIAYNVYEMKIMRSGLAHHFTDEELSYFLDDNSFDNSQLKEIYLGIENGLSYETILRYADPKYRGSEMRARRKYIQDNQ